MFSRSSWICRVDARRACEGERSVRGRCLERLFALRLEGTRSCACVVLEAVVVFETGPLDAVLDEDGERDPGGCGSFGRDGKKYAGCRFCRRGYPQAPRTAPLLAVLEGLTTTSQRYMPCMGHSTDTHLT